MTLRERAKKRLADELHGRRVQTGLPTADGGEMQEVLAMVLGGDPDWDALSYEEKQALLDDVCPEDAEFQAPPVRLV